MTLQTRQVHLTVRVPENGNILEILSGTHCTGVIPVWLVWLAWSRMSRGMSLNHGPYRVLRTHKERLISWFFTLALTLLSHTHNRKETLVDERIAQNSLSRRPIHTLIHSQTRNKKKKKKNTIRKANSIQFIFLSPRDAHTTITHPRDTCRWIWNPPCVGSSYNANVRLLMQQHATRGN